jgi:hypothetical protein
VVVVPNKTMVWNEDINQMNVTNFLLGIPFVIDCTHMEAVMKTENDVT